MLRSDRPLNQSIKDKISLMCDVDAEGVVNCVDAPSIYDVPKILFEEGLDAYVVRELGLPFHDVDWDEWADLLERVHHPKHESTSPSSASTSICRTLPVCHRAIKPAALPTGPRSTSSGLRPIVAKPPKVRPPLSQRRRHRDPRRLRHPRHRRQDRRSEVRP